jgi:hypothetical protein
VDIHTNQQGDIANLRVEYLMAGIAIGRPFRLRDIRMRFAMYANQPLRAD